MSGSYYNEWEKYAAKGDDADDDEDAAVRAAAALREAERPKSGAIGYEFRKNHKTPFPDCVAQPGESDEAAAFRVAGERRAAGVAAFADGTVWGAQTAVDAWGQGLLALERLRNLRRYRPVQAATIESATPEEGVAAGEGVDPGPSEEEVATMSVGLRLNLAQALLKLKDYETAITHCDKALEIDPDNAKGLWRKAKAVWGSRNPGLAREALRRLLELDPGNAAAVALLQEIDQEEARKRIRRTGVRATAADQPAAGLAVRGRETGHRATPGSATAAGPCAALAARWPCCRRRPKEA